MNIEQIADTISKEMLGNVAILQPELVKWNREYLSRCLLKLAEQDVEPVGYIYCYQGQEICFSTEPQDTSIQESYYWQKRVFTEAQLISAQQRTAEACAKYVVSGMHDDDPFIIASGIRNGEWRGHL